MKPAYNFFKNSRYALQGLRELCLKERSFQIELVVFFLALILVLAGNFSLWQSLLLLGVIWQVLIAEAVNSALERVVDMISPDYNIRAGIIKDVGSAIVFLSIALAVVVWGVVLGVWFLDMPR